jgi:hypothetical protein
MPCVVIGVGIGSAAAQVPVIDRANQTIARQTAETTKQILDTNTDILAAVEDTLKAVSGDRAAAVGPLQNLALGQGFSASSMPTLEGLLTHGSLDLGAGNDEVARAATRFINGLQLVRSLSGKSNSTLPGDRSYEELIKSVASVSALIHGAQAATATRRSAFEAAGRAVGGAADVKGSIDQNTQLQVQSGLTLNEMIGVMNGAVTSLQAQNQRRLTDISNSRKVLSYGD